MSSMGVLWRQYLTSDKEYNGVIRFGVTTDSDDITGYVQTLAPMHRTFMLELITKCIKLLFFGCAEKF